MPQRELRSRLAGYCGNPKLSLRLNNRRIKCPAQVVVITLGATCSQGCACPSGCHGGARPQRAGRPSIISYGDRKKGDEVMEVVLPNRIYAKEAEMATDMHAGAFHEARDLPTANTDSSSYPSGQACASLPSLRDSLLRAPPLAAVEGILFLSLSLHSKWRYAEASKSIW